MIRFRIQEIDTDRYYVPITRAAGTASAGSLARGARGAYGL